MNEIVLCIIVLVTSGVLYIIISILETESDPDIKIERIDDKTKELCNAFKNFGSSTEEAADAFKEFNNVITDPTLTPNEIRKKMDLPPLIIESPLTSTLYADNTPILTISQDETIERIGSPKEYCQCEYCGTYYEKFISNCKNCGAVIRKPEDYGKMNCIIETDYINREQLYKQAIENLRCIKPEDYGKMNCIIETDYINREQLYKQAIENLRCMR